MQPFEYELYKSIIKLTTFKNINEEMIIAAEYCTKYAGERSDMYSTFMEENTEGVHALLIGQMNT